MSNDKSTCMVYIWKIRFSVFQILDLQIIVVGIEQNVDITVSAFLRIIRSDACRKASRVHTTQNEKFAVPTADASGDKNLRSVRLS